MPHVPGADHRVLATGTGGAARQTLRILAAGLAAALLLGATPLRQWTEGLGPPELPRAAAQWEETVGRLGLNTPYAALRSAFRTIRGG